MHLTRVFIGTVALLLALCGSFCSLGQAQPGSNSLWRAQSIYQIVTDRFFDGDPSNDNAEGNYRPRNQSRRPRR